MLTWCWSWIWTKHVGWVWASRPWTLDVAGSAWWSQHGRRYSNHYGMVIPSFVQGFLYVSIRFDMIYIYICISLYIIIYHYISLYINIYMGSYIQCHLVISMFQYYDTTVQCIACIATACGIPIVHDQPTGTFQLSRTKVLNGFDRKYVEAPGTYFLQAFCWEMLGAYHQKNIKKWRLKFWGSNKWLALCYCSDSHR